MSTTKTFTVDELANEIRHVDGSHSLGAGALAEALMPFVTKPQQDTEEALRVAMEYVNAVRQRGTRFSYDRVFMAVDALRANPITAKMLEE
jgi:hypothetical protein